MRSRGLTKAVIPVAGRGTRFLPATRAVPKELLPIVDMPVVQLVVQEAVDAGFDDIVLVTCRGKSAIEDYFEPSYEPSLGAASTDAAEGNTALRALQRLVERVRISTVRQQGALGLGHAVLAARTIVGDEPFAVLLPDDVIDGTRPTIGELAEVFRSRGHGVVSLMEVPPGDESRYGMIAGSPIESSAGGPRGLYSISDTVEKPATGTAPSRMAIIGRYVLPASIFEIIGQTPPGRGGEIQLTDALRTLAKREAGGLLGLQLSGIRYDAGDRLGYLMANVAFALKRPELAERVRQQLRQLLATAAS